MSIKESLVPVERIDGSILILRGQKVILSFILAELYGVETKVLNQAVKRNLKRFPDDFMFQLDNDEVASLVSQNVTPHKKYFGGHLPYAFTQEGIAMLSSVINSKRAIQVNIEIMRTFVKMRQMIASNIELAKKLDELEKRYDEQFQIVFQAIRELMEPPKKSKNPIGFG
ncbi:MAG: ORF6N domain-containing protein [Actinobacteria bacterium]|nr:MAG: ORF6N domain-containing protein [Actinomycetota bacterium]